MGRIIVGVILGYVVIFVCLFVMFTAAYMAMGTDGAFQPGTFDVSGKWVATSFVVGFVAAIVGGFVCAAVAPASKAPAWLAGLVLVLGLLMALPVLFPAETSEPEVRGGEVTMFDSMSKAKRPAWVALADPVVGAVGILLGGSLKKKKR